MDAQPATKDLRAAGGRDELSQLKRRHHLGRGIRVASTWITARGADPLSGSPGTVGVAPLG